MQNRSHCFEAATGFKQESYFTAEMASHDKPRESAKW